MVIVISNETEVDDEMTTVNQLFEGGLDRFHYRRSAFNSERFKLFLKGVKPEYHKKISVHLGSFCYDIPPGVGVHYKGDYAGDRFVDRIQSASIHSVQELNTPERRGESYFLVAPVFPSISKVGYGLNETVKGDFEGKRFDNKNLIALGGIDATTVQNLGAVWSGIALKGSIWKATNPSDRITLFKKIKQKWEQNRH
ncbi:beta/alpha barrel domain-containing protein [Luteibaculum oceani]|uniref:Thiamine phosphate synthase n=1 Tax=Luteibaculum oceani TaxID=1294296 RepID=A0A5C6V2E9_9FLAO|nr:hypothetical protein [Luteibaculum oceani]TXC78646.1 hypothetical protein FRX97_07980 [Luteibaculum oceani]